MNTEKNNNQLLPNNLSFSLKCPWCLKIITAQNFSYTNLFSTINSLRGGKVDKVYAGDQQDECGYEPQYIEQLMTDGFVAVIANPGVIMYRI